jgi:hypothetical protein
MFEQPEKQGWFGTKWPLWVFVVLWFSADIPFRLLGYYLENGLGWGWIGEAFGYVAFAVVGVAVGLLYRRRKQPLSNGR